MKSSLRAPTFNLGFVVLWKLCLFHLYVRLAYQLFCIEFLCPESPERATSNSTGCSPVTLNIIIILALKGRNYIHVYRCVLYPGLSGLLNLCVVLQQGCTLRYYRSAFQACQNLCGVFVLPQGCTLRYYWSAFQT